MKTPEPGHSEPRVAGILLITGLLLSFAVTAVYLINPAFLNSTNNRTTDFVMTLARTNPAAGSVVTVDIDDNSLARFGQWPWPRSVVAQLLSKVKASGAASIGLDLILAEPDRTPPGKLNSGLNQTTNITDHDRQLADTLANGPFVLGYEFLFRKSPNPETECGLHPPGIAWINKPEAKQDPSDFFVAKDAVCNRRIFSDAATHSGFLNGAPDADGILRRMPMLIKFEDRLYPSLSLAMLMQHGKVNQVGILRREGDRLDLLVGDRSIAVDNQGNMIVQFSRQSNSKTRISAADILDGKISAAQFKDRIVLIGSSAAGLDHTYQTSAFPVRTHMDIHAQLLDNLLSGQQVIRTRYFPVWETLIGLLVAASICLTIARMGILPSAAISMTITAGVWIGMVLLFRFRGYLLSPLLPTVLAALNYAILTIVKSWRIQLAAREGADSTLILLKSSEKNLNSIIKAVPDIIFRLDSEGRITFISPAISKYTVSPDSLLGQHIFDLVAPDDLPKARYRLNEKRTGERATRDLELRLLLPHKPGSDNDETGHFSITAEGIYHGDSPCPNEFAGTQGIIRDITEQKKLEERLLNAQKMEAIGNLAAGVAHDLNNVLAGLVTYPDLLLLDLPPDSPLRAKISIIQRSGQKAAAIVQDLLTLGRRGVKSDEIVNLNTIISDYLASLEFDTTLKHHPGTKLESSLAPDLLNIKGSRVHLAKAIMNILINAAEAMPAGGKIRLSSYNIYLDTQFKLYEEIPPGEYVCLSVADEGIGITAEDLQRIFEPFYSKKSMRRSGSGLGMTVIWATIKDHSGYIDIQSQDGKGTIITLYLPATREQEELNLRKIVLEDYIGTEKVLIVDDVPEQQQIATNMLTKLGYTLTAVASGEAAVEYLRSNAADIVVLDMIMPGGMDGLDTYKQIIAIRPGQKAIITSGFSESERVKALQQLGVGVYIQKPYTLEKLGVAVRRELDRQ